MTSPVLIWLVHMPTVELNMLTDAASRASSHITMLPAGGASAPGDGGGLGGGGFGGGGGLGIGGVKTCHRAGAVAQRMARILSPVTLALRHTQRPHSATHSGHTCSIQQPPLHTPKLGGAHPFRFQVVGDEGQVGAREAGAVLEDFVDAPCGPEKRRAHCEQDVEICRTRAQGRKALQFRSSWHSTTKVHLRVLASRASFLGPPSLSLVFLCSMCGLSGPPLRLMCAVQ